MTADYRLETRDERLQTIDYNPKIRKAANPWIRKSGNPEIRKSGKQGIR